MHRLCHHAARFNRSRIDLHRPLVHLRNSLQGQRWFLSSIRDYEDGNRPEPTSIRWYDQLLPGKPNRKLVEDKDIEDEEVRDLEAQIRQLDKELKELEEGTSLELLSPEDQIKVKEAREREARQNQDKDSLRGPGGSSSSNESPAISASCEADYLPSHGRDLEVKFRLPRHHDVLLRRLNSSLRESTTRTSDGATSRLLWRWYARCRRSIPSFLELVPDGAWNVLWESQYRFPRSEKDRAGNLSTLLEDMSSTGQRLSEPQKLVLIESLYVQGYLKEALQRWQSEESQLRANAYTSQFFEDLGVRLFASAELPLKAENLALKILPTRAKARAVVLTPVIQAWVRKKDDASIKRAWSLYLHLRAQLGVKIKLEDFDEITSCFLEVGRVDLALAVFKDMMLTEQDSRLDSVELYKSSLSLVNKLHSHSSDFQDLTEVSLTALTLLPRNFQNKFFYGSWLKRLIGMGQTDSAAAVLELMYERGVRPDPKHLNGIIGAFLRNGSVKDKEKAIQMGWAMIQERMDFVSRRRGKDASESNTSPLVEEDIHVPPRLQRIVPGATIETFSLLLLHYERRSMLTYVQYVQNCLKAAEIAPNAYFMNHILYAELRRSGHEASWKMYLRMIPNVMPDLETFACLWDCEKARLDKAILPSDQFPGPRQIFSDMLNWFSKAGKRARSIAREEFSRELYNQIIRCMCLAKDLEGTIVALYALKESFDLYPDQDTARMIVLLIARLGEEEKPKVQRRRRSRLSSNPLSNTSIAKVSSILDLLSQRRAAQLKTSNVIMEDMDGEQKAHEQLYLLTEVLRVVLRDLIPAPAVIEEIMEKTAWEMGTGGIRMASPYLPD